MALRLFGIVVLWMTGVAAPAFASPPPPAKPPQLIPNNLRYRMASEFEGNLSQVIGVRVRVTSLHMYTEQDDSTTTCVVGKAARLKLRMVQSGDGTPIVQPTQKQWIDGGCTRPGYQLIR